jgi:hypothetical protein
MDDFSVQIQLHAFRTLEVTKMLDGQPMEHACHFSFEQQKLSVRPWYRPNNPPSFLATSLAAVLLINIEVRRCAGIDLRGPGEPVESSDVEARAMHDDVGQKSAGRVGPMPSISTDVWHLPAKESYIQR